MSNEKQLSAQEIEWLALSIGEELKAFADYLSRWALATDEEVKQVYNHIMIEELKHAAMEIAILAKDNPEFGCYLFEYLNADSILDAENKGEA